MELGAVKVLTVYSIWVNINLPDTLVSHVKHVIFFEKTNVGFDMVSNILENHCCITDCKKNV